MRKIPPQIIWIFYRKPRHTIGNILCRIGWHDPQDYPDGKPLEHDGFCVCCGKWKIGKTWTNDMNKFRKVIR